MSRVAVILTSYNRPTMVRKAIASVVRQTYSNWILYVMDDNSREDIKAILRRCSKKDARIKVSFSNVKNQDRMKTCRYAVQINKALRISKEPLITLLTDDAGMYQNKLTDMVHWMNHHPNADVCYGTQIAVNRSGKKLFGRGGFGVVTKPAGIIDHNQIMFRRRILAKVGYWPENPGHPCDKDAVWFMMIVRKGIKFYPINKRTDWLIYHRKRLTNLHLSKNWDFLKSGALRE